MKQFLAALGQIQKPRSKLMGSDGDLLAACPGMLYANMAEELNGKPPGDT